MGHLWYWWVINIEEPLNEHFDISATLKCGFRLEHKDLYALKAHKCTRNLHLKLKEAKILSKNVEKEKLVAECTERSKQYDIQFKNLSDYQILELSINENLDEKFNGSLDKVTSLASLLPVGARM